MKLATKYNKTRDGVLIVVSRDLSRYQAVPEIAPTMQAALDNWSDIKPKLEYISDNLNTDETTGESLVIETLMAPLPRAFQWADGSAYVNHVELVRKARGAELPPEFWTDPLMYQGGSDDMQACHEPIRGLDPKDGIDFESEVVVVTNDVPLGVSPEQAGESICLIGLVNDVSLRNLIPAELAKGFGFFQSKPASHFTPVFVTPDELGDAWQDTVVQLPLITHLNGELFGKPFCHHDMTFNFAKLIAHAAKTRRLKAGCIIGSGTVSNLDRSLGSSCLAEKRMLEIIDSGAAKTAFLQSGDRVKIEMLNASGESIFGAIDHEVASL